MPCAYKNIDAVAAHGSKSRVISGGGILALNSDNVANLLFPFDECPELIDTDRCLESCPDMATVVNSSFLSAIRTVVVLVGWPHNAHVPKGWLQQIYRESILEEPMSQYVLYNEKEKKGDSHLQISRCLAADPAVVVLQYRADHGPRPIPLSRHMELLDWMPDVG